MQPHDGIADENEEQGLNGRYTCEIDDFRPDVTAVGEAQEFLAFEECPILDYLLSATAHANKRSYDHGHEEVADQVLVVHHGVAFGRRKACEQGADDGQKRSL